MSSAEQSNKILRVRARFPGGRVTTVEVAAAVPFSRLLTMLRDDAGWTTHPSVRAGAPRPLPLNPPAAATVGAALGNSPTVLIVEPAAVDTVPGASTRTRKTNRTRNTTASAQLASRSTSSSALPLRPSNTVASRGGIVTLADLPSLTSKSREQRSRSRSRPQSRGGIQLLGRERNLDAEDAHDADWSAADGGGDDEDDDDVPATPTKRARRSAAEGNASSSARSRAQERGRGRGQSRGRAHGRGRGGARLGASDVSAGIDVREFMDGMHNAAVSALMGAVASNGGSDGTGNGDKGVNASESNDDGTSGQTGGDADDDGTEAGAVRVVKRDLYQQAIQGDLKNALEIRRAETAGEARFAAYLGKRFEMTPTELRFSVRFRGVGERSWRSDGPFLKWPRKLIAAVLKEVAQGALEERSRLRPLEMAIHSPRMFWNLASEFPAEEGGAEAMQDGMKALVPEVDWSFLNVRDRRLSEKARRNLVNQTAIVLNDSE